MWPGRRQKIFLQIEEAHLGQPLSWISYTDNWKKEIWSLQEASYRPGGNVNRIKSEMWYTEGSAFPMSLNCLNQKERGVKYNSARDTADYVNGKTFRGGGAVYRWKIMSFYPLDLFTWTWRVLVTVDTKLTYTSERKCIPHPKKLSIQNFKSTLKSSGRKGWVQNTDWFVFSGFSKISTLSLLLILRKLVIDSSEISLKWKDQFL